MSVNILFLIVGHTHEDIDQLVGVVVSLILQLGHFQTIVELMEYLWEKPKDKFVAEVEEVTWTCLSAIRDFQRWVTPLDRCVWNCFAHRQGLKRHTHSASSLGVTCANLTGHGSDQR